MNSHKFLATIIVTLAFVLAKNGCDAAVRIQWDKPVYLCGSTLSRYTSSFCQYNGDLDDGYVINTFPQIKKIVEECCYNPCTARFIYMNYCIDQNFDLSQDLVIPSIPSITRKEITTTSTTTETPKPSFISTWHSILKNNFPTSLLF